LSESDPLGQGLAVAIAAGLYFAPSAIALGRSHRHAVGIIAVNLLLGWTFIGWLVALVWSALRARPPLVETASSFDNLRQDAARMAYGRPRKVAP
jgi:hypothetical protein